MKKARKEFETRTTQFEKGNYEETVESLSDEELNERREGKDYEEMSRRFDADVARAEEGDGEDVDDDADEKLGHHEQDYGSGAALPEIADSEDEGDDTEERAYEIIKTTNWDHGLRLYIAFVPSASDPSTQMLMDSLQL